MALSAEASPDGSPARRLVALGRRLATLRPLLFIVVGGLNTLIGYGLFAVFYLLSHQRQASLVAATVIGVLFNFFTTGRLVFANHGYRMLFPFVLVYAVVLALNMAALEALARAGVSTLGAQAIALPILAAVTYLLNRYIVFAGACRLSLD